MSRDPRWWSQRRWERRWPRPSASSWRRSTPKTTLIRYQFHQCFTSSFYTQRSQKRQIDSQVKQLFALSGSSSVKAARKLAEDDSHQVLFLLFVKIILKNSFAIVEPSNFLTNIIDVKFNFFGDNSKKLYRFSNQIVFLFKVHWLEFQFQITVTTDSMLKINFKIMKQSRFLERCKKCLHYI